MPVILQSSSIHRCHAWPATKATASGAPPAAKAAWPASVSAVDSAAAVASRSWLRDIAWLRVALWHDYRLCVACGVANVDFLNIMLDDFGGSKEKRSPPSLATVWQVFQVDNLHAC